MRFEEIPETNCLQDETIFTDDNYLNGEHNPALILLAEADLRIFYTCPIMPTDSEPTRLIPSLRPRPLRSFQRLRFKAPVGRCARSKIIMTGLEAEVTMS